MPVVQKNLRPPSAVGRFVMLLAVWVVIAGCNRAGDPEVKATVETEFDVVIRNGTIYDGTGGDPYVADLAIVGDRIAAIGQLNDRAGARELDASGLAVAPGFINPLSWANESLLVDGRSLSDIRQGVTLEILGEGWSMGPLNAAMKDELRARQSDLSYSIGWTSLDEYLLHLERRGLAPNVASFVGATTLRIHVLGYQDRAPTAAELERMQALLRVAMKEGALGVSSALIYAPGSHADTDELVALAEVAGEHGGVYISHIRSETDRLPEAIDEVIEIARRANVAAEIYHLKAAGPANWALLEDAIERIETARAQGLSITANMYPYTAGATGLEAGMPPWVQVGGHDAWLERLRQPLVRARVVEEMRTAGDGWENLLHAAGSADNVLLIGFRSDELKPLTGKTLAAVAASRGVTPEEAAIDLVLEDNSRVLTAYTLMSDDNLARKLALPWMSIGSDEASLAPEGPFLLRNPHPRAYGSFARVLGHYVRERAVLSLAEAIRRMTALPAKTFGLTDRGRLREAYYADVVVFDAAEIRDTATFTDPHRYADGVVHVFVNGIQVLDEREYTGALPGRVVRGPGWSPGATQ